jgi:hypothetical protein
MMTRDEILQEFHRKSENVLDAEAQDLLDRDEAQAMIDRYRSEADEQIAALVRETALS